MSRFSIHANTVHSGRICGAHPIETAPGTGQLHLMTAGTMTVRHVDGESLTLVEPSVLLSPRPVAGSFVADETAGATLVCAELSFGGGSVHPVIAALPSLVSLPLSKVPDAAPIFRLIGEEAAGDHCGRKAVLDSLCHVAVVHLLRELMDQRLIEAGLLAGLGHPRLSRAIVAMHDRPATAWTLEAMAEVAGMSRTAFACEFRDVVGATPFAYLQAWRIGLAQAGIRDGRPLKLVALDVGYAGEAALSRAFRAQTGQSPREWKKAQPPRP